MTITENNVPDTRRLNALDPRLPSLATQAAIELDNLRLGRQCNIEAIEQLALRLANTVEEIEDKVKQRSLMDPATMTVFSRAISGSSEYNAKTIDDVATKAWQIAQDLTDSKNKGNDNEQLLERLKVFCIHLAKSAIAHERPLYEAQPLGKPWG